MNTIINTTEVTLDTKPVRTKNAKAVFCITDHKVYASGIDASEAEGIHATTISVACRRGCKANGKLWCFVKDMPIRILDISSSYQDIYEDAMKYRAIEAERKAKEARQQALQKLEEKIEKHKLDLQEMREKLEMEQQMYAAMEKEFNP